MSAIRLESLMDEIDAQEIKIAQEKANSSILKERRKAEMKRLTRVAGMVAVSAALTLQGVSLRAEKAFPAPVPQTGQKISYTEWDDATYQAGVPWPNPRFTVDGDCVTDNLTGLMWAKSFGPTKTWTDALAYCKQLDLGGHKDWRMPNMREQLSLIDYTLGADSAKAFFVPRNIPFKNVPGSTWTSTTFAPETNCATYVSTACYQFKWVKTDQCGVLPVRGGVDKNGKEITKKGIAPVIKTGQTESYAPGDDGDLQFGVPWPNPRFTDNGNETVTDNVTGLMWSKNANLGGVMFTTKAIRVCESLELGGYKDWRVPNIKEMQTLIDYSMPSFSPAPFVNAGGTAWCSTIWSTNNVKAWVWVVNFMGYAGGVGLDGPAGFCECNAWAVRGGILDPKVKVEKSPLQYPRPPEPVEKAPEQPKPPQLP